MMLRFKPPVKRNQFLVLFVTVVLPQAEGAR